MSKRVLVTGASGLLGRHIYREFLADPSWTVLGLAFSRVKGQLRKVDITQSSQVEEVVKEFKPSVVVHSAAERRPDNVENEQEATKRLNVDATRIICQEAGHNNVALSSKIYLTISDFSVLCVKKSVCFVCCCHSPYIAKNGAIVLFISTDYVFDGNNSPYQTDAQTNPLNKYGQSKLEGECVVMETNKANMVLRVPVLYGSVESLDESAVTTLLQLAKDTSRTHRVDNHQKRFPTHCADVASVLRQLLDRRLKDESLTGIFHWSGDEMMTKYDMLVTMARVFSLPIDHVVAHVPGPGDPTDKIKRPYNTQLDTSRLQQLGISSHSPFQQALAPCLRPLI